MSRLSFGWKAWGRCEGGPRSLTLGVMAVLITGLAAPTVAHGQDRDRQGVLERIAVLERLLNADRVNTESTDAPTRDPGGGTTTDGRDAVAIDSSEAAAEIQAPGTAPNVDLQTLLDRIEELERRLSALETSAVMSEPETRVRRVEVWVDDDGVEYDHEVEGARRVFTYQRERVYRRQTISEKIEEALAADAESRVSVGVDAAFVTQFTSRSEGSGELPTGAAYGLASADLFFAARIAQNTLFFADVVGLSGSPPDTEVPSFSLVNGYTARLGRQNELNLREAWVRTELFSETLAISAGRLDLTNYFDRNQVANDETSQFLSDVLVNNPALGLSSNGVGAAAVFDPRGGFNIKLGFQQSDPEAANLSESIYSLAEFGYVATPLPAGEGHYRVWFRTDNSTGEQQTAVGLSLDQKLAPAATFFGRFGSAEAVPPIVGLEQAVDRGRDTFYSLGVGFQNGLVFNRWDTWGVGYAHSDLDIQDNEDVVEGYYNFGFSDRLRLSAHLQYFRVSPIGGPFSVSLDGAPFSYFVSGIRFQAGF